MVHFSCYSSTEDKLLCLLHNKTALVIISTFKTEQSSLKNDTHVLLLSLPFDSMGVTSSVSIATSVIVINRYLNLTHTIFIDSSVAVFTYL